MTDARRNRASRRLDRQSRLAAYALAGGAALAAAPQAEADIIHTVLDPNVTIGPGNTDYNLDLNNDGTIDFFLNFDSYEYNPDIISLGLFLEPVSSLNGVAGYTYAPYFYPYLLNLNDPIGPGTVTVDPGFGTLALSLFYYGITYPYYGYWAGGANGGLLGLSFSLGGETFFGWARMSVDPDTLVATLTDYAYESTPNTPILAGAVPEPTSLGLLALGALGVVAHRARMRARAEAQAAAGESA